MKTQCGTAARPRGGASGSLLEDLGTACRRWLACVCTALAVALASSASAQPGPAAAGATAAAAGTTSQAALLYHNYCSVCHGDKGDGMSRAKDALSTLPRDFTSTASRRELTRERIVLAITHGRPGTAMVAWKSQLSPADIETLADHLLARFVRPGTAAAAGVASAAISGTFAHGGRQADREWPRTDMAARLPERLRADPKRGAAFYMANCATCHGVRGDGAGPRAYFITPRPRNFTDAASRSRLNRPALFAGVSEGRIGTEMPAWNKVASPQQIADVAEYVFQAFIAPAAPAASAVTAAAPPR